MKLKRFKMKHHMAVRVDLTYFLHLQVISVTGMNVYMSSSFSVQW